MGNAMESWEERIARYRAENKAKMEALDRSEAELEAERDRRKSEVVRQRDGSPFRDFVFLVGVIVGTVVLIGLSVTLTRLAGKDFGDAQQAGQASVAACAEHGPVTTRGFGYWDQCTVTVVWDDGDSEELTVGGLFRSSDIGTPVRVGDMGRHRTQTVLSRADVPERPWLRWLGYALGAVGAVPILLMSLMLGAMLTARRRR